MSGSKGLAIGAAMIVLLLVWFVLAAMFSDDPKSPSSTSGEADRGRRREGAQSTGNVTHDRLLALGAHAQASFLGQVINEGCTGEYAFFMGLDKETNAYWSVRCANRKSYQVQINPNATGSTSIMDCELLKAVAKVSCFVKLDQQ